MTSRREKMMAVLRNQTPLEIPFSCYHFMLPSGSSERVAREQGLGIIEHFPGVSMLSPPYFARYECLSKVKNAEFSVRYFWNNAELVEVHQYETPVGTISQHVAKEPGYGSYYRKKHYITQREDYKIVQYITENTVFQQRKSAFSKRKRELGEDGVLFSRLDRSPYQKLLIELARPERFFVDLHEAPAIVEELMGTIGHRLEEQFGLALDSEADIIWAPDNITSDMTPPNNFKKYVLPHYNKLGKQCDTAGKIYAVHMDGKLNALKEHIAAAHIHVIESFSLPEIGGDIPLPDAVKIFGDKVICPNFPSPLSARSKDEIKNYLSKVFSDFGAGTPFMIQISEDLPSNYAEHVLSTVGEFLQEQRGRHVDKG